MRRDLGTLADRDHDLLVVGGGIHGALVAWDAVLRGLSVALVERDDFGGATSANSLKLLHGGLRRMSRLNFRGLREQTLERSAWLRVAPHLSRPLGCIAGIYGGLTRGHAAFGIAAAAANLAGIGRNRGLREDRRVPPARLLARTDCLARVPALPQSGLRGGILWYDAQMLDSERLTLAFVIGASERGARVANYAAVESLVVDSGHVRGATVVDRWTERRFEIRARAVVDAAGPWSESLVSGAVAREWALGVNLVLREPIADFAIGIPGASGRYLFCCPWRGRTLAGTFYRPIAGLPTRARADIGDLERLIGELNAAAPNLEISESDVIATHAGLIPLERDGSLVEGFSVVDQAKSGLDGLLSVRGSKYTTARIAAELAVDRVVARLGDATAVCRTRQTPLPGAEEAPANAAGGLAQRLAENHGGRALALADRFRRETGWDSRLADGTEVRVGEVIWAVREEMALTLGDVMRRTALAAAGPPSEVVISRAAEIAGAELGWDESRLRRERACAAGAAGD